LYGLHDVTFSANGYAWLAVNLVTTSAYQVLVKGIVSSDAAKEMGPFGFSYINNLLSLPMLALISVAAGEVPAMLAGAMHLDSAGAAVLALSGALGFCLSVSAFKLNTMIAATSMMVANNVNKVGAGECGRDRWGCAAQRPPPLPFFLQFLVIILSELFVQRTLDAMATAGTFIVLLFGWAYARAR